MSDQPTREEFIKAYRQVFPEFSEEFAGQVWDEFQKPDEEFMKNIAAVCDDVIKRTSND